MNMSRGLKNMMHHRNDRPVDHPNVHCTSLFTLTYCFAFATWQCWRSIMFSGCPSVTFVRLSRQMLLPQYLMNSLSSFDETCREYLLAPTDDLIRLWRSKVRVTAGRQGQNLWTPYLMNYFSSLDETYTEYPPVSTDDLVRFWSPEVKVTATAVRVVKASTSMLGHWGSSSYDLCCCCHYVFKHIIH